MPRSPNLEKTITIKLTPQECRETADAARHGVTYAYVRRTRVLVVADRLERAANGEEDDINADDFAMRRQVARDAQTNRKPEANSAKRAYYFAAKRESERAIQAYHKARDREREAEKVMLDAKEDG